MSGYFDEIFSKYQFVFRKWYSTQQCLLALLEKWKTAVDKGKVFWVLLIDKSKAFDCLNHESLIAKLNTYGLTLPALKLIHDYLSNRNLKTGVNNSYSAWFEILSGIPQGSILGSLLLSYFWLIYYINKNDIANYADDNTSSKEIRKSFKRVVSLV